jgi:hypothetical protein
MSPDELKAIEIGDQLYGVRVLWRGRQWFVTEKCLICPDGAPSAALHRKDVPHDYWIDAPRLKEMHPDWTWIYQVGKKSWCDEEEFFAAYLVARLMLRETSQEAGDLLASLARVRALKVEERAQQPADLPDPIDMADIIGSERKAS